MFERNRFRLSNAYIALVIVAGAVILGHNLWTFTSADLVRFISFIVIATVASGLKVNLVPSATMSMSFVFILIGIAEFSPGEALLVGCLGALAQCTFRPKKRLKFVQVAFSVGSLACSIQVTETVHHAARQQGPLLTAVALFLANTWMIAMVIALTERKKVWKVWRDTYFWSFPNYLVGAAMAWAVGAVSNLIGWQPTLLLLPTVYVMFRSYQLYLSHQEDAKKSAAQQKAHLEEISALHRRTIETMAIAVEAKDQTTHDHLRRVEVYATEIGRELGLNGTEMEALTAAALLHDIGKLGVPEYIISKPGKLTPEEFEKMKTHTVIGCEIVERMQFPYPVAPMVRGHHEKWNGTGYPDGLAGEQIPIGARILAVVDCLDALASDRQYRRALPLDKAIEVVVSEAGQSFDPKIVEILARRYVELQTMATSGPGIAKLPMDVKVERGAAPAAGFEEVPAPEITTRDLANLRSSISGSGQKALALAELSGRIAKCEEQEDVFADLRSSLRDVIPYDAMVIYLRCGDDLVPACVDGDEFQPLNALTIPLGTGLSGWVAETGKPIVNGNPSVEPWYPRDPATFGTLHSALAVPLITTRGITGVVSLYLGDSNAYNTEHRAALISLSSVLAGALEVATLACVN